MRVMGLVEASMPRFLALIAPFSTLIWYLLCRMRWRVLGGETRLAKQDRAELPSIFLCNADVILFVFFSSSLFG